MHTYMYTLPHTLYTHSHVHTPDAGSITGITLAVILAAICIFIALLFGMHIKPCHKWMTIIKEGLLKHTENTMQLYRVDLFSASHSNGDEGSRDHPSNMSESSGEQYQTPQQAMVCAMMSNVMSVCVMLPWILTFLKGYTHLQDS